MSGMYVGRPCCLPSFSLFLYLLLFLGPLYRLSYALFFKPDYILTIIVLHTNKRQKNYLMEFLGLKNYLFYLFIYL